MQLLTKTPLNRCPVRFVKKWPTYQETGFSLYYVFKMKKSQDVKDFVKIEGRERGFCHILISIRENASFLVLQSAHLSLKGVRKRQGMSVKLDF